MNRLARIQARPYEPDRPDDPPAPDLGGDPEPGPRRDFQAEARAMFPWLDPRLLNEFSAAYADLGSVDLAWGKVRQGSTYRRIYGAILRDDGTLRMSELEYHSVREGFARRLASFGLNPQLFQGRFDALIEGDVSPQEFESRLQGVWEGVAGRAESVRRWYADNYGLDLSPEAIFASAIDPDVGTAVLERRISNAQIGGAAARFNFQRSLARVEELQGIGVSVEAATRFYSQAARDLPGIDATSRRHNRGAFTLEDLEEAGLEGDPLEQTRLQRGLEDEQASFSRAGVARGDDAGRRTGLTPR